jgi:flagellar basal body-associated protein FliL
MGNKTKKRIIDINKLKKKIKQVIEQKLAPSKAVTKVLLNTFIK